MSKRLLLASIEAGGGHFALRDSFASVLEKVDPMRERFTPIVWNSRDRFVQRFYSFTNHYLPRFQGTVYALSDSRLAMEIATRFFNAELFQELQGVLQDKRPDVVVSTHALLSMMLVKAKRSLGLNTPIVSAIPDYGIPSASFNPPQEGVRPDGLIVMSEETRAHYERAEGLTSSQVHLSGFVTRPQFAEMGMFLRSLEDRRSERPRILRELEVEHAQVRGLDPSRPTVLFMGGSAWTAKSRPVLEALLALPEFTSRINVIVVCGRDEKFRAEVSAMARPWKNFAVFGFVPAEVLSKLMAVSDFPVLGSLAPASMQELLELGCGPLMLFHYIPGAELPHTAYIRDQRIGRYEPDPAKMLGLIMQLTGFAPMEPDARELLTTFPAQARKLRVQSAARALELPEYLAGFVEPLRDAVRHAEAAARTTSRDLIPAVRM